MAPPERVITAVRVQTALFLAPLRCAAVRMYQHLTQGVKSREFSYSCERWLSHHDTGHDSAKRMHTGCACAQGDEARGKFDGERRPPTNRGGRKGGKERGREGGKEVFAGKGLWKGPSRH